MLRLTLRSLRANKIRLALTTVAVVLGVSFIVASFVLADGLNDSFDELAGDITSGTDLAVRPVDDFGRPQPMDESVADLVAGVDGIESLSVIVSAENVMPVRADGTTIPMAGPPQLGFNWIDDVRLGSTTVVEGRAPESGDEFTMDLDSADRHDFVVGETYAVVTSTGRHELTLVGTTRFGADNTTLGAVLTQYPTETAQRIFGLEGRINDVIAVVADDADVDQVIAAVSAALPEGLEAVDQRTVDQEQQDQYGGAIDTIRNVLLGFAFVSLFVASFIITNTFAILVGQRTRELGLLRAIGAESRQVRRQVVGEALAVGLVGSIVGLGVGVLLALGIRGIFSAIGAPLPDGPVPLPPRTILFAVAVGLGVTLFASLGPSRRAATIPPIAALNGDPGAMGGSSRRRLAGGAGLLAIGLVAGSAGLFAAEGAAAVVLLMAVGAIGVFLGVSMLSPLVARPVSKALGAPLPAVYGTAGVLARENAGRNPRRTASTAAALMIGLALVSTALVVGQSIKVHVGDALDRSVLADLIVRDDLGTGFTSELADRLEDVPELAAVTGLAADEVRVVAVDGADVEGGVRSANAVDLADLPLLFDIGVPEGATLDAGTVLLHEALADDLDVAAGQELTVRFPSGAERTLTVEEFDDDTLFSRVVLDRSVWNEVTVAPTDLQVFARTADGVELTAAQAAVTAVTTDYPQVQLQTTAEFKADIEAGIDSALNVLNALLALAVIIALIGIANTVALSVYERTRELGLLRAVGMTRRQLRRTVRWEAAIVATFGAVLGVAVGLLFGAGVVRALPAEIVSSIAVPFGRILTLVVVAAIAGLIAAWLPARRAGKLAVLDAIRNDG